MDWKELQAGMPPDRDLPERAFRISALRRVLHGQQYDHLTHPFGEELSPSGEYIPLGQRRPAVRHGWCRVVVDDATALLFGDGRFPGVTADSEETEEAILSFAKATLLPKVMTLAAVEGSVGSVVLHLRVLKGKPRLAVMPTAFLTPIWRSDDPDTLESVTERYRVKRAEVVAMGYILTGADADAPEFWFQRRWDADAETWYIPWPTGDRERVPQVDPARTVRHGLGLVPMVWIENLPGSAGPDGACTFEGAIDTTIEADYQLSQSGRGLRYASDPKLVLRDPSGQTADKPVAGGSAQAIILTDEKSEAKFLEISGSAAAAVLEHVRNLRRVAMEAIHGSRIDPERIGGSQQSGRALEILESPLIQLADQLRTSYGEGGLLSLVRMLCAASAKMPLTIGEKTYSGLDPAGLNLIWPRWFPASAEERQADATTTTMLVDKRLLSRKTALSNLGAEYDVDDVDAELAAADADQAAADARDASLAASMEKPKPVKG